MYLVSNWGLYFKYLLQADMRRGMGKESAGQDSEWEDDDEDDAQLVNAMQGMCSIVYRLIFKKVTYEPLYMQFTKKIFLFQS